VQEYDEFTHTRPLHPLTGIDLNTHATSSTDLDPQDSVNLMALMHYNVRKNQQSITAAICARVRAKQQEPVGLINVAPQPVTVNEVQARHSQHEQAGTLTVDENAAVRNIIQRLIWSWKENKKEGGARFANKELADSINLLKKQEIDLLIKLFEIPVEQIASDETIKEIIQEMLFDIISRHITKS